MALSDVKKAIASSLDHLTGIDHRRDHPALFAAWAALVRLQHTFQASVLTIKCGLHFETAALERLILEQLAWISAAHSYEGDCFKLSPKRCLAVLQEIYPCTGPLHGLLTSFARLTPETTVKHVQVDNEGFRVQLSDREKVRSMAYYLVVLADMYSVIGELIYADRIEQHRYIQQVQDGRFVPRNIAHKGMLDKHKSLLLATRWFGQNAACQATTLRRAIHSSFMLREVGDR